MDKGYYTRNYGCNNNAEAVAIHNKNGQGLLQNVLKGVHVSEISRNPQ